MSDRISWLGLPWWAWALITWGASLVVAIIVAFAAPSNLWTLPNNREENPSGELSRYKSCDKCTLFNDRFYLAILRPDQCEAPHYLKTASCDLAALDNVTPGIDKACNVAGVPKNKQLCITGTILEPQNTWSNFGYILAGILILFSAPRLLGVAVGVNFCLIGLFSGLYHATLAPWTQSFDVAWIYALLFAVLFYAAESIFMRFRDGSQDSGFPVGFQWVLAGLPIAAGVLVGILKTAGDWGVDSTTATIVLLIILGAAIGLVLFDSWLFSPYDDNNPLRYWNLGHWLRYTPIFAPLRNWLASGLESKQEWLGNADRLWFGLFMAIPAGISFWLRLSDGCGHPLCSPHAVIQPHATWHVLGAVALWWVYDFFAQASSSQNDTMIKLGAFGR